MFFPYSRFSMYLQGAIRNNMVKARRDTVVGRILASPNHVPKQILLQRNLTFFGPDGTFWVNFHGRGINFSHNLPTMTLINSKIVAFDQKHNFWHRNPCNKKGCVFSGGFRLSGGAQAGPRFSGGARAGPLRVHKESSDSYGPAWALKSVSFIKRGVLSDLWSHLGYAALSCISLTRDTFRYL